MNFSEEEEVIPFPDAWYVLSVDSRLDILRRHLRSIQRLHATVRTRYRIRSFPISLHAFLEILTDSAHAKLTAISDISLILVREVFEIGLSDVDTSFGNIRRHLNHSASLRILGKICDSKRDWKVRRNERFHSGFSHSHDENDTGFEMASLWRDRGASMIVHDPTGKRVSLQALLNARLSRLAEELERELVFIIKQIRELLSIALIEFEARFKMKIDDPNSFMKKVKNN